MILRYLFTLLCCALLLHSCAGMRNGGSSELVSINIIDQNGITESVSNEERIKQYSSVNFMDPQPYQKVLRVFSRDQEGNVPSVLTSYHENGQIKQYLEAQNTRAYGMYREWHSNGLPRLQARVIGGEAELTPGAEKTWLFDGICYVWNQEGCLEADFQYSKGKLEGLSHYYHPNGKIWKSIPYRNNLEDGEFEVRRDNGILLQKGCYAAGKLNGSVIRYWDEENLSSDEQYRQGMLLEGIYYNANGKKISEVNDGNGHQALFGRTAVSELRQFQGGIQKGLIKNFTPEGYLVRKYSMSEGVKHGEETEYFDPSLTKKPSSPKLLVSWYEGKIQGSVKTWYINGVMESQREFSNNLKNGLSTAWYRNGELMLIEEYEKDKLIKGEYFKKGERYPVSQVKEGNGIVTYFDPDGNFIEKAEYFNGMPAE